MSDSVFEHALDLWSKANLPDLQRQLDESVLTVKELEAKSLNSRKSLATETKQFKRLEEGEKLTHVNKMIKQYQQEVDSLTSRSKFSEEVLLNLYAKLAETPDPRPLLEASARQVHDLSLIHIFASRREYERRRRGSVATAQQQVSRNNVDWYTS